MAYSKARLIKMRQQADNCRYTVKVEADRHYDSASLFMIWDDLNELLHIVSVNSDNLQLSASRIAKDPYKITSIDYAQILQIEKYYE